MATGDQDDFLSKISIDQKVSNISLDHKDHDDDKDIESILNKDDENISKTDLDSNISTLIEKL